MTETPPPPPMAASDAEARNQAKLAHILNGFFPIVGGLIIWLTGKDKSAYIEDQGKEATNFGFTLAIGIIAGNIINFIVAAIFWPLSFITWLIPVGVWVFGIIQGFQGGKRAEQGEAFRYKYNYTRFIK